MNTYEYTNVSDSSYSCNVTYLPTDYENHQRTPSAISKGVCRVCMCSVEAA